MGYLWMMLTWEMDIFLSYFVLHDTIYGILFMRWVCLSTVTKPILKSVNIIPPEVEICVVNITVTS